MPPRARPPWENSAAVDLLRRLAPEAPLSEHRARWLALLGAAFTAAPKLADAAARLEVAPRTLANWLRALREQHPALYAGLPPRQGEGRPWPAKGEPPSQQGQ